jgi:quercetin dioxygenase-like cupin family protein
VVKRLEARNRGEVAVEARSDGVEIRRLVRGDVLDLTEYAVPRGFTTGASDHDVSEKVGYVVSGKVEITTEAGTSVVEAGGAYAIPRGLPHRFTVVEDTIMIQVRSPVTATAVTT